MTSPTEPPSPPDTTRVVQLTKPLRELAALVLLGANAVFLFVGLIRLLVPMSSFSTFTGRATSAFGLVVGVESIVLPVLAFLLATHIQPVVPKARLITQVALGQYVASAGLGGLAFLIALVGVMAEGEVGESLLFLLTSLAAFALLGVAALVVHRVWRTLYHVPKPKPQPGVYGQPRPGWPQQGYPGYPPPGAPGQGGYGTPPGFPAPPYGSPPQPGVHPAPPYGSPPAAAPFGTGPSFGAPPSFGGTAPPFGQPSTADPTQAIPQQPTDRPQVVPSTGDVAATQAIPPTGDVARTQAVPPGEDVERTQRVDPDNPAPPR